ncbi:hypothetical protein BCR32DRAFT_279461 [Anaeromyces robustus]|uniref:Uncharacterized protein n=1 Tax=Anaeromyces robustus TaxID=1754192 RepID=A0A1Y1X7S0_9FUNG|nr:hypothetical protein BCR32DRAFT_279461 [Anaeromyces robustus]|eukprot:ORX81785.1 hypothetical protein BCR32DRAFT_279461 [Anaeromyces robustus]
MTTFLNIAKNDGALFYFFETIKNHLQSLSRKENNKNNETNDNNNNNNNNNENNNDNIKNNNNNIKKLTIIKSNRKRMDQVIRADILSYSNVKK